METVNNAPTIDSGEAPDLYVPNYMSFNNDNIFLGSFQGLRFKMTPDIKEMTTGMVPCAMKKVRWMVRTLSRSVKRA